MLTVQKWVGPSEKGCRVFRNVFLESSEMGCFESELIVLSQKWVVLSQKWVVESSERVVESSEMRC